MKRIQIYLASFLACFLLIIAGTRSQGISDECINCICETGCNITEPFWMDGGKLRLPEDKNIVNDSVLFQNCRENTECSTKTIQQYMIRYEWDCNNDGVINCTDYLLMHKVGPYGCDIVPVRPDFLKQVQECLQREETTNVYEDVTFSVAGISVYNNNINIIILTYLLYRKSM